VEKWSDVDGKPGEVIAERGGVTDPIRRDRV
jgi:hypothetical protein